MLGITDTWAAWQVDAAVHAGGTTIDAEVSKAEQTEAAKRHPNISGAVRRTLERVLGIDDRRRREARPRPPRRFDPDAWSEGRLVPLPTEGEGA